MTEDVGFACEDCGRVFPTPRSARIHRTRAHGGAPEHGTLTRYRNGCRCEPCKDASREQKRKDRRKWRDHSRAIDGRPETLRACLLAFGVSEADLARALAERGVEDLHWGAWRASGGLRKHCRCEVPDEIAEELRRAS